VGFITRPPRRNTAAGAVDVEVDVLIRILGLEEEELRDHEARADIVDILIEEDDSVL